MSKGQRQAPSHLTHPGRHKEVTPTRDAGFGESSHGGVAEDEVLSAHPNNGVLIRTEMGARIIQGQAFLSRLH